MTYNDTPPLPSSYKLPSSQSLDSPPLPSAQPLPQEKAYSVNKPAVDGRVSELSTTLTQLSSESAQLKQGTARLVMVQDELVKADKPEDAVLRDRVTKRIAENTEKLQKLESRIADIAESIAAFKAEKPATPTSALPQMGKEEARARHDQLSRLMLNLDPNDDEDRVEIEHSKQELAQYEAIIAQHESDLNPAQNLLSERQAQIKELHDDILSAQDELNKLSPEERSRPGIGQITSEFLEEIIAHKKNVVKELQALNIQEPEPKPELEPTVVTSPTPANSSSKRKFSQRISNSSFYKKIHRTLQTAAQESANLIDNSRIRKRNKSQ